MSDVIPSQPGRRKKGRKIDLRIDFAAHLEGPPDHWTLDELGRPLWISKIPDADWGKWAWVMPPQERSWPPALTAPAEFDAILTGGEVAAMPSIGPSLARPLTPAERTSRGRPKLHRAEPAVSRWAAGLCDLRNVSSAEIGRRVSPRSDDRSCRRIGVERLRAGRRLLHAEGILPWILWPTGALPPSWWTETRFFVGLEGWRVLAATVHERYTSPVAG